MGQTRTAGDDNGFVTARELEIDHLVLALPGLSGPEAGHLAWLVGEAVRSMDAPVATHALERLRAPHLNALPRG